jgi:hypothetical protein
MWSFRPGSRDQWSMHAQCTMHNAQLSYAPTGAVPVPVPYFTTAVRLCNRPVAGCSRAIVNKNIKDGQMGDQPIGEHIQYSSYVHVARNTVDTLEPSRRATIRVADDLGHVQFYSGAHGGGGGDAPLSLWCPSAAWWPPEMGHICWVRRTFAQSDDPCHRSRLGHELWAAAVTSGKQPPRRCAVSPVEPRFLGPSAPPPSPRHGSRRARWWGLTGSLTGPGLRTPAPDGERHSGRSRGF